MALYSDGANSRTIVIYFIQYGASCSKEMRNAFSVCQEAKFHPKIISEDDIKDIELGSNVVIVLESFSGETFDYLSSRDCLVVGPCCICSCVSEKIAIPNNGSPVFNIALRGVVISSTKLDSKNKNEVQKLANYMGAVYSDDLTLAVTHLIAEKASLQSGKFVKASENNIPVISPDWIKKSWEVTQMGSKAPDAIHFKLPPFRGMYISCSNLSVPVKKKLQTLIEANGGIYQRTLELNKTAVLVIGDPEGKKWQHAQQWGIPCVSPSWVHESAERGCLAPSKNHLVVARPKCSTPTNSGEHNSFMSCSDISVVPMGSERSNIDETDMSFASDISIQNPRSEGKNKKQPYQDGLYKKLLEEITLSDIKAAGLFLDGCKIFLSGFAPSECEKLKKIINSGGATLYTSISDSLSHVVVGDFSMTDAKELTSLVPRPHVVKLEWLIQCLKEKRTIGVEPYLCLQSAPVPPASPLSHKGVKLLKSQNGHELSTTAVNESRAQVSRKLFVKATVVKPSVSEMESNSIDVSALERRALEEMNKEKEEQLKREKELEQLQKDIEAQRIKEKEEEQKGSDLSKASKDKDSTLVQYLTSNDGDQSTVEPFFQGLWFDILGYDEIQQIQESIELVGGKLVTSPSDPKPDYAIVPVEGTFLNIKAKNTVTIIFVEDCYDHGFLISEIEYYHQPLPALSNVEKNLEGTVLGLSGFTRAERRFLVYVANKLGALVQDMFSRADHPDKGVKKSTHLICKEMSGKKYEAALKWGIPAVGPSWLLDLVNTAEKTSSTANKSKNQSFQESNADQSIDKEKEVTHSNNTTQPMAVEVDPDEQISNITPVNQILRRLSVPGSAGPPPFHIQTPETPYGKALTDCTPSPSTRKQWKKWIDNFPDLYEGSPSATMKARRPSTPLDVIKKQLWVKYGGVSFDGIEPGTGNLLPNGPYKQWANDSAAWESFIAEAEETKNQLASAEGTETCEPSDIISVIQRRISDVRSSQDIDNIASRTNRSADFNPAKEERLSSKFELLHQENSTKNTNKSQEDDKHGFLWNFEKAKQIDQEPPRSSKSETPKENIPLNRMEASKRPYSATKTLDSSEKLGVDIKDSPVHIIKKALEPIEQIGKDMCASPEQVPRKIPRIDEEPTRVANNEEQVKSTIQKDSKVFLLSGLPAPSKQKYEGIIRLLGGTVTQTPTYDPATTHIIVEKPIRSEKLLCCIASGKWVLHTSYVDSCYETRSFLPEEEFEWGNQQSAGRLPRLKPGSTEAGLANASYRWRQRKQDMGSASPFREMKVVLFTAENKLPQFTRLLEAGSATILEKSQIFKANYVIWEEGKVELPVSLSELAQQKIHIVPPVYLGEYLVKTPSPSEYYPASYTKLLKQKKSFSKR